MTTRHLVAFVLALAVLIVCWPAFRAVANLGLRDERDVQIAAAPFLFAFLISWEGNRVFRWAAWNAPVGIPSLGLILSMYFVFLRRPSYGGDGARLILAALAVILAWMAVFILCYGLKSFRAACFPLCCLLLMIPVPAPVVDKLVTGLQHGSAAMSYRILQLTGTPVFAQGMIMSLPGLEIEVAPECSGIRSFLALALAGVLAGRVCLRSGWSRLALIFTTIPIAILKNALRIAVIAWLSVHVDRAFLYGRVHHYGGLVFTPLGVALFVAILIALQRCESWAADHRRSFTIKAIRTSPGRG